MSHPQIRKKIAALLAMTQASGCTEAEAIAAATKAANAVAKAARDERFAEAKAIVKGDPAKARFGDAVLSGWAAGGKVNLTHGVGGGATDPRRIGGV
jgi:hypothetical protein